MSALVSELPFGVTSLNVSNADKAATEIRHVQIVGTMKSGTMPLASIYCLKSAKQTVFCHKCSGPTIGRTTENIGVQRITDHTYSFWAGSEFVCRGRQLAK